MPKHMGRLMQAARRAVLRYAYRRLATRRTIDPRAVLLDQQHGRSADGSLHYVARELADRERYGELSLYFAIDAGEHARIVKQLRDRDLPVSPVRRTSLRYYRLLATSGHLVCDTSFPLAFAKREGQVLWNTWHGTPLKTLGRSEAREAHLIGNVQKCLAQADYLSVPNGYTARRIVDDYMLEGICHATLLYGEYPRNEPFAHPADPRLRARYIPEGTRAYAYLPTFRSSADGASKAAATDEVMRRIAEIDALLSDGEVLFARLHPAIERASALVPLAHVRPVPGDIELYGFLNLCDALVTDYSSVMFDFALTRKKVVLFAFDRSRYLAERGLYRPLDELPFPQADDAESLVRELRGPKGYDDSRLLAELAPYGASSAAEKLCRRVFLHEGAPEREERLPSDDRAPALVLVDRLPDDSERGAFTRMLLGEAASSRVFLAFPCSAGADRVDFLASLPPQVGFIPYAGRMALSPRELVAEALRALGLLVDDAYARIMDDAYAFEARRVFGDARFNRVTCLSDDRYAVNLARHVQALPATGR